MKQITIPDTLEVGEYYSNDQIQYALEVGNSGGIRPKLKDKKLDFIVLITSSEEKKDTVRNPYADKIEGDILTYTGAGLKGNQEISGVNKRILEQKESAIPILGFLKEDTNKYKFIGFLFLLRNYEDYQIDSDQSLRNVLIFEFQIFSNIPELKIGDFGTHFTPLYNQFKASILPEDRTVDSILETNTNEDKKDIVKDEKLIKEIENLRIKLLSINPYEFEQIMADLIEKSGFLNVKVTKKSGDDGIDINGLFEHDFSLNLNYQFQVKRWKHSVGRNEVANLRGSLGFHNLGVIISTSHFTSSAINEANSIGKAPINLVGIKDLYEIIKKNNFTI